MRSMYGGIGVPKREGCISMMEGIRAE